MNRRISCSMMVGALLLLQVMPVSAQDRKPGKESAPDRGALEKQFAKTMSGAVLVGRFSVDGRDGVPKQERYTISSAKKVSGDRWIITARIRYGGKDETLPIPIALKVMWAGDTPVITLTDLTIPGMGTFTARVLVYRDRYAGMWQHDAVGGEMWGRIERADKKKKSD